MPVSKAPWLAGGIAAGSVALMAAGLLLAFIDRHLVPASDTSWDPADVLSALGGVAVAVTASVIAARRPANPIGWLGLTAGLALSLTAFATSYGLRGGLAAPGSLPAWRAAMWLVNWLWGVPTAAAAFVFLLFPTGRLRTRRWRPAVWFVAAVFFLLLVASAVSATRYYRQPFTSFGAMQAPAVLSFEIALVPVAMLVSVSALVWRFIRSAGEERLQMKWLALAAALVIVAFVPDVLTGDLAFQVLLQLAFLCVTAAIAVAVLKYRLYDIDIVISKAIQYGVLAAFITAVYAALVAGIGTAADERHSAWLSAIAAGVAAIAFQPARQRAAQFANRVVYGRRATPYQALSQFARRIGGTYADEDVLPQMARIVAAGTGAARVVVWLRLAGELRPAATAGPDTSLTDASAVAGGPAAVGPADREYASRGPAGAGPAGANDTSSGPVDTGSAVSVPPAADDNTVALPDLPGADTAVPITYKGELLGAIAIRMPRDEPLRPAGAQLVADMAAQAGPVLSNVGLVSELRASRQRLVTAQDEARRRLERNLHDGAQQDLVALAIKLNLLASADGDPAEARQLLSELKADTTSALENLRDLARGIYPPLLADHGLVAALGAQARKSPVPLTIEADGIGRFPEEAEAAVYFCCLEALQNTAKYARAGAARIELGVTAGSLCFTVTDDGAGYDAARAPLGAGLRNMTDRLAALGGSLQVRSAPGHGTTVAGRLPVLPAGTTKPATAPPVSGGTRGDGSCGDNARRPSRRPRCRWEAQTGRRTARKRARSRRPGWRPRRGGAWPRISRACVAVPALGREPAPGPCPPGVRPSRPAR